MRHGGSVGDAGVNIRHGDLRVVSGNDFLWRETVSEEIQHHGHPDAVTPDARTASAAGGIDPDVGVDFFGGHGGSILYRVGPWLAKADRWQLGKRSWTRSGKKTNGLERFARDSNFDPDWHAHLEELRQVNPED